MIRHERIIPILNKLLERSQANEVRWKKGEQFFEDQYLRGREFTLRLEDALVILGYFMPGTDREHMLVDLCNVDGEVEDQWRFSFADENWQLVEALFLEASRAANNSDSVLSALENALEQRGPIGCVSSADKFLNLIAGEWQLTYYRGEQPSHEDLIIDRQGKYYLKRLPHEAWFALEDIDYDPSSRKASFTKVDLRPPKNGRRRQTEILTLNDDLTYMEGIAAHDGHRLSYARVEAANQESRRKPIEAAVV